MSNIATHLEHLARALTVTSTEDGCVHIVEARALEERMCRVCECAAHARHRANGVGARPQVGDASQELQRVSLLRDMD
jgi:hypothetical protein